jgi:hypothetical protein
LRPERRRRQYRRYKSQQLGVPGMLERASTARLRRFELGAVPQHGMHDDREPTGERASVLCHRGSFGDRECPVF